MHFFLPIKITLEKLLMQFWKASKKHDALIHSHHSQCMEFLMQSRVLFLMNEIFIFISKLTRISRVKNELFETYLKVVKWEKFKFCISIRKIHVNCLQIAYFFLIYFKKIKISTSFSSSFIFHIFFILFVVGLCLWHSMVVSFHAKLLCENNNKKMWI